MQEDTWPTSLISAGNTDDHWIILYDGPKQDGQPVVDGQITTPSSSSITSFRALYGPLLDTFCANTPHLKILEVGAGFGHCTLGIIDTYKPEMIIASDAFPSLMPELRSTLDRANYRHPKGICAIYDANYASSIPLQGVNIVIGHSVLHHITHWRRFLLHSLDILDADGLLVFGEPSHESWATLILLTRTMLTTQTLSEPTVLSLTQLINSITFRLRHRNAASVLDRLEDKHLFSQLEIGSFAADNGLKLTVGAPRSPFKDIFIATLRQYIQSEADLEVLRTFSETTIGLEADGTILCSPFQVFSLKKTPCLGAINV